MMGICGIPFSTEETEVFQILYDRGSRLPIIQAASANQNVTNNLVEL